MQHIARNFITRGISQNALLISALGVRSLSTAASSSPVSRAIVYSANGPASSVLKVVSYKLAPLTPKTVYLKFLAAPINPSDINTIEGSYPIQVKLRNLEKEGAEEEQHDKVKYVKKGRITEENGLVAVCGNEGVAEVIEVGSEVKNIKKGEWVIMRRSGFGTWRTYAAAFADDLIPIDCTSISPIVASTISVNPCTAYRMLKDFVKLKEGDCIVQNGANSAVGQMVIQLAKFWGLTSINIVRERSNYNEVVQHLRSLGATYVIPDTMLTTPSSLSQFVSSLPPSTNAVLGLNCVSGPIATHMCKLLSPSATVVTYGAMSLQPIRLAASLLIFKDFRFVGFWMTRWYKEMEAKGGNDRKEMLEELLDMFRTGKINVPQYDVVKWGQEESEEEALNTVSNILKKRTKMNAKKQIFSMV
ncbi:8584_t:CDS:2 [Paraglomus occultum]|uniref:enoyl-[acyl-carrier-protein] reductase n=1 Tax=Paraglomus occultum TaxID=144539 RepID=A0A9N8W675_9GLOM|nr:8584_t:CDS:2 [Paraglomus occultum]